MSHPGKLKDPIIPSTTPKGALDHAGGTINPPVTLTEFSLAVDRHADGSLDLVLYHGGNNWRLAFDDAHRRALGRAILEPHPECPTCDLEAAFLGLCEEGGE